MEFTSNVYEWLTSKYLRGFYIEMFTSDLQRKYLRVLYIEIITWALRRSLTWRLRRILSLRFTGNIFRRKRNESFTTKPPLRRTFNNETSFDVNSSYHPVYNEFTTNTAIVKNMFSCSGQTQKYLMLFWNFVFSCSS